MGPIEWIRREFRFLRGLARVFRRISAIDPQSSTLICDDFEQAVDRFADLVEFARGSDLRRRTGLGPALRFAALSFSQLPVPCARPRRRSSRSP